MKGRGKYAFFQEIITSKKLHTSHLALMFSIRVNKMENKQAGYGISVDPFKLRDNKGQPYRAV